MASMFGKWCHSSPKRKKNQSSRNMKVKHKTKTSIKCLSECSDLNATFRWPGNIWGKWVTGNYQNQYYIKFLILGSGWGRDLFFFQHHSYCNREIKKKKKPFNISGRVARCRFKHRVGGENEGRIDLVEASRKTKRLKWI